MTRRDRFFLASWPSAFCLWDSSWRRAPTLPDLFQKGKTKFKLGSYRSSLARFNQIIVSGQAPVIDVTSSGTVCSGSACPASSEQKSGYVQQSREEMEVLFTLLAEHYERRSVLITSNLVFSK